MCSGCLQVGVYRTRCECTDRLFQFVGGSIFSMRGLLTFQADVALAGGVTLGFTGAATVRKVISWYRKTDTAPRLALRRPARYTAAVRELWC